MELPQSQGEDASGHTHVPSLICDSSVGVCLTIHIPSGTNSVRKISKKNLFNWPKKELQFASYSEIHPWKLREVNFLYLP